MLYCHKNNIRQHIRGFETEKKILGVMGPWKLDCNSVLISEIVLCKDRSNVKATQLNTHSKNKSNKINICFITNSNIKPR